MVGTDLKLAQEKKWKDFPTKILDELSTLFIFSKIIKDV